MRWPRSSLAGVTGGILFGCASFTPSLLPRNWVLQGVVGGLSAVAGYAVGVGLAWLVFAVSGWAPSIALRRRLWILIVGLGAPLIAVSISWGQVWQREVHELTGERPPSPYAWIPLLVLAMAVFVAVVAVVRVLRWLVARLARRLIPMMPARLARPLAVLTAVLVVVGLGSGLVWRGMVSAANTTFGTVNDTTRDGTFQPVAPERSGSPASLVSWESLGFEGREFVARGPGVRELTAFSGVPAQRPVRAYAGLRSADSTGLRAALAVRDLRRAGGFERAVLVVATTTGTGMVDRGAVDAIEYMYNGDTAVVGLQYSYLPSWISVLVDHVKAEEAGRELFNQVYDAWAALPPDRRPALLVTGTSLGTFGGETAFSGLADIRLRTDGVVWAGPPKFAPLHRALVEQRDPGTPERLPIYDAGRTVRFADAPEDLWGPGVVWDHPRVVYLQNASDPIVYWSPRLAFAKPEWLSEPRGRDVSPNMVWIPVVTFWQLTADLPFTLDAQPGHGHNYRGTFVDAWAAVSPPPGWRAQDSARLRALLEVAPD